MKTLGLFAAMGLLLAGMGAIGYYGGKMREKNES